MAVLELFTVPCCALSGFAHTADLSCRRLGIPLSEPRIAPDQNQVAGTLRDETLKMCRLLDNLLDTAKI
jgi:hypothetical protein